MNIRTASPDDYDSLVAVMDTWWGRPISHILPRLFLDHFWRTSFVATDSGELTGFLVGFLSPSVSDEAYIHAVGVAPAHRRSGLAATLYTRFFDLARADGRRRVRAITSPQNSRSVAFHRSLGFAVSAPIAGYDGDGVTRVVFAREL